MDIVADIVLALIRHGTIASYRHIVYGNWQLHIERRYAFLHDDDYGIAWAYR